MFKRLIVTLVMASAALTLPLAASAQTPSYASQDQQIHGRVVSFNGAYSLQVRDDNGYIDNVELHQGTIINPTGLTLAPGMIVSIDGYNAGSYFVANEIDTPYTFYGDVPYYLGHPWYYYGPSVSLGFFFGHTGWWHGGGIGHTVIVNHNNVHVYNHAPAYHGGAFHGRNYVASPEHGGYVAHGGHFGGGGHGGGHGH